MHTLALPTHLVPWTAPSPSLGKMAAVLWKCMESSTFPSSWISHGGSCPCCPFCPRVPALGQSLQLGALIRLVPLWMLTSPLGSVPEGLSFSAQLRKAPSPCLVQCHHVCISRKESAGWRSTDLPGILRIQEPLTGLLYGIPEGRCTRSHTGSHFILTTLKGSASPTWRRGYGGQQGRGRARCRRQGVSLGTALHLAISRDKFSSERPEGLDPSCPTFSWAPGLQMLTPQHTCTEFPDWCPQALGMAVDKISMNMATTDSAAMLCQQWS